MADIHYIKCPRCDLNYIDSRQNMCDVCKAELGLAKNVFYDEPEEDDDNVKMCPICKVTVIGADEDMCEACAAAREIEAEPDIDVENDEKWKTFLDDEDEVQEETEIPLEELQDEEYSSDFDEEEDDYVAPPDANEDDFDEVNLDDVDLDDEDLDDDEDADDEEDLDDGDDAPKTARK